MHRLGSPSSPSFTMRQPSRPVSAAEKGHGVVKPFFFGAENVVGFERLHVRLVRTVPLMTGKLSSPEIGEEGISHAYSPIAR